MSHSTECEACGFDGVAIQLEACGDGDESEGVTLAIADFEVIGVLGELWSWEFDRCDEFVGVEIGVELWRGAGETVEVGDWDGAFALGALTWIVALRAARATLMSEGLVAMHLGCRFAAACSEDGVDAIEAVDGGAAAAGVRLLQAGKAVSMK